MTISPTSKKNQNKTLVSGLCLLASVLIIGVIYSFAWSGSLHFDDFANLQGLERVFADGWINQHEALLFVLNGNAGPLGRPIALASFLMDGSVGLNFPAAFFYTNTMIHLLNGLLLAAVLFQIGKLLNWSLERSALIACISAVFWLLLPIHVSASMMSVQRMTLLSSSMMLLGLLGYLVGRQVFFNRPLQGSIFMLASLGLGTLFGVLTKEQAALLPLLTLVLESTLLRAPPSIVQTKARFWWRATHWLGLVLPSLLVTLYVLYMLWNHANAYALRDFSLAERLGTESVILWDYLRLAFLPNALGVTPFSDDYTVLSPTNSVAVWFSALLWLMLLASAFWLRRKASLFAFAVLWFLAAHLLESSVIPLELYFAHRNYLALVGPIFAAIAAIWLWAEKNAMLRAVIAGLSVYALLLGFVLWQTTSLWGQPLLAAEMWAVSHPHSERATQYLAQRYVIIGDTLTAKKVIDRGASTIPHQGDISLQALQLACVTQDETADKLQERVRMALRDLPKAKHLRSVFTTLDKLKVFSQHGGCQGVLTSDTLLQLAQAALANPRYASSAQNCANIELFLATMYIDNRDLEQTMLHLEAAIKALPDFETLVLTVGTLNSAGLFHEALELMQTSRIQWASNLVVKRVQQNDWASLLDAQKQLALTKIDKQHTSE